MSKRIKLRPFLIFILISSFAILLINTYRGFRLSNAAKGLNNTITITADKTSEQKYEASLIKTYEEEQNFKLVEPVSTAELDIHSKSAITYEIGSNKVLFAKNQNLVAPIASLTKIMTAVVAMEHKELSDEMIVSEKAANIGENAMGISSYEVYTLEDLLYGLILHSGNDAAIAIAEGVAGSEDEFVKWMNIKAKKLELRSTYFADASGLDDNNVSTAYDLAKLTRYALKNPDFKKIAAAIEYEIYYDPPRHNYLYLSNQTNLLRTYPGVAGVKTGFTEAANLCLVTYASSYGYEIIGVTLGTDDRKFDMVQMLDYSFGVLGLTIDHPLITF